jgi:hypothetical protein
MTALDGETKGEKEEGVASNTASIAAERRNEKEKRRPKEATENITIVVIETRTRTRERKGKRGKRGGIPRNWKPRNTSGGKAGSCRCCDRGSAERETKRRGFTLR